MRTFKTLLLIVLSTLFSNYSQAQSMKDPVSFKLKNGLTVIVAENQNASKIFSNFNTEPEGALKHNKVGAQEIITGIMNDVASKGKAGVTFSEKGANVAALTGDFEKSLTSLSTIIQEPLINQQSFDQQKTILIASLKAKDHYYPESLTIEALNNLTLNDVRRFYIENTTPSKAFLTIAGKITPSEAKNLVKKTLGQWEESTLATTGK